ncbi:hypothetical protein [Yersinia massiliensis]|uniref:hypothetical protein n=1 Tax=Yersinia massiliensis TaxID=419257 RepID=UPI000C150327|nr:hypothetical protein [Yersinia massiliensis]PHZ22442.1 hypothetical protein CS535_17305 [Yersinia massiliensis]
MAEGKGSVIPPANVLSILDGLWQFDKLMKFIYYVLFLDTFLVWNKGFGIFKLSSAMLNGLSIGDVVSFLIFFGFFSSLALIVLGYVFSEVFDRVRDSRFFNFGDDSYKPMPNGCVYLGSLAKFSMETQSDLAYKIYKDAADEKNRKRRCQHMAESVSVGCFFVFVFGWYLSSADASSGMIIDWLYDFQKNNMSHAETGWSISILLFIYVVIIYQSYGLLNSNVYYPPLYEIEEKERKRIRERDREMRREFESKMREMEEIRHKD